MTLNRYINLENTRWLLLLVFVIGYLITYQTPVFAAGDYLFYSLLALLSCMILLIQLKSYDVNYSAIWLSLLVFIGVYFIRFYWITLDPLPVKIMLPTPVYNTMILGSSLLDGFRVSVIAFTTFSISIAALLYINDRWSLSFDNESLAMNRKLYWFITKCLFYLIPLLMIVLAYVSHKYHIGEMGADSGEPLPFRLKGIIFYARFIMIPLLIMLLIYLAEQCDHIIISRIGIVFLMLHGVIDMLLRGSRSSLLLSVLLLVFLVMSGGLKLFRSEKTLAFLVLIAGLFMVPIMTEYRMHRVVDNLPVIDAILTSMSIVGNEWWTTLLRGIEFVFFRIPGIEAVSAMISLDAEPLGMQTFQIIRAEQGIAGYLTHDVYGITRDANTLSAPSFVGWFYLVNGAVAVATGALALALAVIFGWWFLGKKYFVASPIARTFFLWMLFTALTEGTLDSMLFMFVVGVLVLASIEAFIRIGTRLERT